MSLLQEFIELHYIGSEQTDLLELLKKYELYPVLDQIVSVHHNSLMIAGSLSPEKLMPLASSYATMALTAINLKIGNINPGEERKAVRKAIVEIGLRLYLSFIRQFPDDMIEITRGIKDSLPDICAAIGYDYNELTEHLNVEQLEIVIKEISGAKQVEEIRPLPVITKNRLQWCEKGRLDYLSHELKSRNWIKKKSEWTNFLDANKIPRKVHWNELFKAQLAHLLYTLRKRDFIRPNGTKGYFAIAEDYIRDYSGKNFTKRAFKKLSSKINGEKTKYKEIIREVDEVMKSLGD